MATLVFDQEYRIARDTPSDINEHIEVLKNLADSVEHVTEMGTRTGVSTRAFLASDVTLRAYDPVSYTHLTPLLFVRCILKRQVFGFSIK